MDDLKYGDVLKWAATKLPEATTFMYVGPPKNPTLDPKEAALILVIVGYDGSQTGSCEDRWLEFFRKVEDAR